MNTYELMLILDPGLLPKEREGVIADVKKVLEGSDTKQQKKINEKLLGKKRLSYEIGKLTSGDYMLYNFDSDPESIGELNNKLNILSGVVRYMINKVKS